MFEITLKSFKEAGSTVPLSIEVPHLSHYNLVPHLYCELVLVPTPYKGEFVPCITFFDEDHTIGEVLHDLTIKLLNLRPGYSFHDFTLLDLSDFTIQEITVSILILQGARMEVNELESTLTFLSTQIEAGSIEIPLDQEFLKKLIHPK